MPDKVFFVALIADICYYALNYIKILGFNYIVLLRVFWSLLL